MSNHLAGDLYEALLEFDGRNTEFLRKQIDRFASAEDYRDLLIASVADMRNHVADGATWLLLAHLRDKGDLSSDQLKTLIANLDHVNSWAAQLHLCQSVRLLAVEADEALVLAEWVRPLLTAQKPFLRAWSLDAFLYLCAYLPSHSGEGRQALEAGLNDPAASVRARARNLAKNLPG